MSVKGTFILPHPPLIIPEIGKGQEAGIRDTIESCHYCALRIAALRPQTIVVVSPHTTLYQDYFHISPGKQAKGDFSGFRAGKVVIEASYDTSFVETLEKHSAQQGISAGTMGERQPLLDHGTMIPLYFINQHYRDYKLVRIGLSGFDSTEHYRLGMCITETADMLNRDIVLIASGDLSHKLLAEGPYGYAEEGPAFDRQVTQAMEQGDFLKFLTFDEDFLEKAAECGLKSFQIMAGTLDKKDVDSRLLSYEGPFGVGYGAAAFIPTGDNEERAFLTRYLAAESDRRKKLRASESIQVALARNTLEQYIRTGQVPSLPADLPGELLDQKAATFVSIKKNGRLRGCIGTLMPVSDCIGEEILNNAISAGTTDPRFDPVQIDELDELEYSVDVLSLPEPIADASCLDVKKYGVIVSKGSKRGVLLPDLAGVDTVDEQIRIACQKAGIREKESVKLERFEVIRYQ